MSQEREVSQEMQNAFVDGQLDAADWTAHGRAHGQTTRRSGARCASCARSRTWSRAPTRTPARSAPGRRSTAAAGRARPASRSCSRLAGWLAHDSIDRPRAVAEVHGVASDRIVVHVASSRGEVVDTALQEVEDYLRDARAAGRQVRGRDRRQPYRHRHPARRHLGLLEAARAAARGVPESDLHRLQPDRRPAAREGRRGQAAAGRARRAHGAGRDRQAHAAGLGLHPRLKAFFRARCARRGSARAGARTSPRCRPRRESRAGATW